MSDDAEIKIINETELHFSNEYGECMLLCTGIGLALELYKGRPESYVEVFADPERFERQAFQFRDELGFGSRFVIDLGSEKVRFEVWAFVRHRELFGKFGEEKVKSLLVALLPHFTGKVPKMAASSIKSDKSFLEEFWDREESAVNEKYAFLESGSFEVPFSELEMLEKILPS